MHNPMLQQMNLNQIRPQITQLRQTIQMLKTAQNPNLMFNQMLQNTALYKQYNDIVSQYGGDVNKAFTEYARRNGYDPNEILNMLK